MDLLTVLAHELGHVLGHGHHDAEAVMSDHLEPGARLLPGAERFEVRGQRLGPSAPRSAIRDSWSAFNEFAIPQPASRIADPASRIADPTSLDSGPSTVDLDALFARLEDDKPRIDRQAGERGDDTSNGGESDDGLDLWSLLYGFERP